MIAWTYKTCLKCRKHTLGHIHKRGIVKYHWNNGTALNIVSNRALMTYWLAGNRSFSFNMISDICQYTKILAYTPVISTAQERDTIRKRLGTDGNEGHLSGHRVIVRTIERK